MSEELAKNQLCIVTREGVEIWIDVDRAKNLVSKFNENSNGLVEYEGRFLSRPSGIYTPQDLQDMYRRRRGEYQCKHNKWHGRNDRCECSYEKRMREHDATTRT